MTDSTREQLPDEFREQPLTARMLDDFATCPRKFLLSFFTSRDAERHFRGGSAALHQAVRAAVIDAYGGGGPAHVPLQLLQDSFEAHWDGSLCADTLEEGQLHAQGLQLLREYHADRADERVEILGTDERLTGQIGEQEFVAVADLLLSPAPGQLEAVRLVTSRSPLGPAQLAQDLSAQVFWLLAQDRPSDEPLTRRVVYQALRKRTEYEVVLTDEEAQYAQHDLASRVARLQRETAFEPHKGKYCRWCRSRSRCPAWQR